MNDPVWSPGPLAKAMYPYATRESRDKAYEVTDGILVIPFNPRNQRPISQRQQQIREKEFGRGKADLTSQYGNTMENIRSDDEAQIWLQQVRYRPARDIAQEVLDPECEMVDTGLLPDQVIGGAGKDFALGINMRGMRHVSGSERLDRIFLPYEQQYRMPATIETTDRRGLAYDLPAHVFNPEAFFYLVELYIGGSTGKAALNWSDVMFVPADRLAALVQDTRIMPEKNPFLQETVYLVITPNDPDNEEERRITTYAILVLKKTADQSGSGGVTHELTFVHPDNWDVRRIKQDSVETLGSHARLLIGLQEAAQRVRDLNSAYGGSDMRIRVKVLWLPEPIAKSRNYSAVFGGTDGMITLGVILGDVCGRPSVFMMPPELIRCQRSLSFPLSKAVRIDYPKIKDAGDGYGGPGRGSADLRDAITYFVSEGVGRSAVDVKADVIHQQAASFVSQFRAHHFRETTIFRDATSIWEPEAMFRVVPEHRMWVIPAGRFLYKQDPNHKPQVAQPDQPIALSVSESVDHPADPPDAPREQQRMLDALVAPVTGSQASSETTEIVSGAVLELDYQLPIDEIPDQVVSDVAGAVGAAIVLSQGSPQKKDQALAVIDHQFGSAAVTRELLINRQSASQPRSEQMTPFHDLAPQGSRSADFSFQQVVGPDGAPNYIPTIGPSLAWVTRLIDLQAYRLRSGQPLQPITDEVERQLRDDNPNRSADP